MTSPQVEQVLDARDTVGESIVWDERRGALLWVDILGHRVHRLVPESGEHRLWPTPEMVTSVGLREDGGAVLGLTKRVLLWDFDDAYRELATIEPALPDNRLNEGVVGPDGAFWVGTMQNNVRPDGSPRDVTASTGRVYRVDTDGAVHELTAERFGITNTMAWTDDGRFIVGDTLANALYAYTVDPASSALGERRLWSSGFERGYPDGSCLDAEGYLWNCRVAGGACLTRLAPDGTLDRVVELPCSWPTSCCFGGRSLARLYVTSARFTMSDEHLARHPQEGALFAVEPGVRGRPSNRFGQAPLDGSSTPS